MDIVRWMNTCNATTEKNYHPAQDQDSEAAGGFSRRFGSAHAGVFNTAFCDGSGQSLSFDVDPETFEFLCRRNDDGVSRKRLCDTSGAFE
jgi:prepilin-type processing-associated H-X9-DG protein